MQAFEEQAQQVARLIIKTRTHKLNLRDVQRRGFTPDQMKLVMLLPSTASDPRVQLQTTRKDMQRLKRLMNIVNILQQNDGAYVLSTFAGISAGEWTRVNAIMEDFLKRHGVEMDGRGPSRLIRSNNDLGMFLLHYLQEGMSTAFGQPVAKDAPDLEPGGWVSQASFLQALGRVGPLLGLNGESLKRYRASLKKGATLPGTILFYEPNTEHAALTKNWLATNMTPSAAQAL